MATDAAAVRRRASRMLIVSLVASVILLIALVALAVKIASKSSNSLSSDASSQLITYSRAKQVAPRAATLKRLGGGSPVVVGGETGHPLVVNFFASWCPACKRELKAVAEVASTGRVSFVGVDTDETSPGDALRLLHHAHATYPVGEGSASLAEAYGTGGLPTTAFLDAKGRIVALALGALTRAELSRWVGDLVGGKPL